MDIDVNIGDSDACDQKHDPPVRPAFDENGIVSSESAVQPPAALEMVSSCEKPMDGEEFDGLMQDIHGLVDMSTLPQGNEHADSMQSLLRARSGDETAACARNSDLDWDNFNFEPPEIPHAEPPGHSQDIKLGGSAGDTVLGVAQDADSMRPHLPLAGHNSKRRHETLGTDFDDARTRVRNDPPPYQAKRPRLSSPISASSDNPTHSTQKKIASDDTPPVILRFNSEAGRASLSSLASRLLAQEQESRNSRWRRTRDEPVSIDKVALAKSFKNKPTARGCWGCVNLEGAKGSSQCSLLEVHGQWPCNACAQDNLHCDLITAPIRKVRCTDCKRQNLLCSYSYTRNHEQACEQCAKDGHRCVAGPAKDGGIIPRIGIMRAEGDGDEDDTEDNIRYVPTLAIPSRKGKAKVAEDCRECASSGCKCIYPINLSTGPCRSCKREKLPCTMPNAPAPKLIDSFHPARSQARQPQPAPPARQDRAATIAQKRRDSVLDSVEVARGTSKITRPISTNYRHPMVFNCSAEDCTFCRYPDMQVTGIGMKRPEVANIPEYSGFIEISGGYAQAGIPNTRLCSACTMSRSSILYCRCHDMEMMSGINYSDEAQAAATARLLDDDYNDLDKHCNVCFQLATYSCVAVDPEDGDEGCGLKLCEGCMLRLLGEHDKDLGGLVTAMVDQGEQCRSDAELLRSDGALMRYGHWRAQCEVERERERR
ncbi:hypothetical protein TI39_contig307g00047 [Zymoseptoria brevis]|uniref:Zn(2)-C6 fungal-type domain-containing protein n=1 Tax=Zymoseptoria brevis TaxID=1047168 RepID=A0A0F4GXM9_9PEZI|nr:hypothetical protein TI39_contig307g00047 [Zymoseptoria brevis]